MHMYVYMCVHTFLICIMCYVYIGLHVGIALCSICVYFMYMCTVHICLYVQQHMDCARVFLYMCMSECVYIHANMCVQRCMSAYACRPSVCMCLYVYVYVCMCIHGAVLPMRPLCQDASTMDSQSSLERPLLIPWTLPAHSVAAR